MEQTFFNLYTNKHENLRVTSCKFNTDNFRMSLKHILKTILVFILIAITYQESISQVTTVPALPTADNPVSVYFDATGTPLEGYSGTLYAHTGVNIQGVGNWQNVIGSWGNNTTQPSLERLEANLYKLEITPSIRSFYNVNASQVITHMCFVFRSSTGSPQSADYFVEVVEAGVVVVITSPTGLQPIFELNDVVTLSASANYANLIELYVNDIFIDSTTDEELSYDWLADEYGRFDFKFIAVGDDATVEAESYFYVRPEVNIAELPDGVISGINYVDNTTVTLVLQDPPALKEYVFVLGEFNEWGVGDENFMNRTPDGEYFWITLTGLTSAQEYAYQYYIDGELRIADPYSHKVLDPWNDKWISSLVYPNLKPYPEGKTTGIVSVFQTSIQPYEWEVEEFTPPAIEEMVVYELLIRDFVGTGAIKTVMDSLDYLQQLGVNVIELMPINEFEGNISWGYNPSFYFATDKAYGTINDYKKFIDECHKRGIAVVIDMVLNHSFGQSPLVQMYFDPNAGQWGQPMSENPWYNETCPHEPWCWGYDFDHESPYTVEFINRVNEFWLTEFKVDGFRFDFTKGFTNTESDGWNYDASRIQILKNMADHIWSVNQNAYVILEHFTANNEEKVLADYGMIIWGNVTHSYQEAAMGWVATSDFSWISYKNRGWNNPNLIGYMESHDEERIMYKNLQYGNSTNSEYDIKNLEIALKRASLVAAFYFPIPGPKMIWQFGEMGYDYSINHCQNGTVDPGCRTDPKPVRWDYLNDWRRKRVYQVYSALAKLKTTEDIFNTTDFTLSVAGDMKRIHLTKGSDHITVIGNFGVEAGVINPNFQKTGKWYEYFLETELDVSNVNEGITLQPGEYRLYSTKKFASHGYPLNVNFDENSEANVFVFPNPSKGEFYFNFLNLNSGDLVIEIFDINGQLVYATKSNISSGNNSLVWNTSNNNGDRLNPGVYLYRVVSGKSVYTGKLISQ